MTEEILKTHDNSDNDLSNVRTELINELENEIIGPREPEEILDKDPKTLYLDGMLVPQQSIVDEEENEDNDDSFKQTNLQNKSTFGLSCTVEKNAKSIQVKISYGIYNSFGEKTERKYKRKPIEESFTINLETSGSLPLKESVLGEIKYYVRETTDSKILSVYLINTQESKKMPLQKIIFQPKIEISSDEKIFKSHTISTDKDDPDEQLFGFLFLDKMNFATGHGCSVDWNDNPDNTTDKIWTVFMPKFNLKKINPTEPFTDLLKNAVSMKTLSKVEDFAEYEKILSPLANEYEKWIQENLISKLNDSKIVPQDYKDTAENQIKECKEAVERIKKGIKIISTEKNAGKAFQFTNRVMALQQTYGDWARKNIENEKVTGSAPTEEQIAGDWRMFQLAFILMNIETIIHPTLESRKAADLLWFPTGGGKTEAYLGLIAFTMALRRLSAPRYENGMISEQAYGVNVIMRYTLRLLTIQQFQRASALMCACEYERRRDEKTWGDLQFNVGLWVGAKSTPNQLAGRENKTSAESTLVSYAKTKWRPEEHNPIQLLNCPWCGENLDDPDKILDIWDWREDKNNKLPAKCRAYCPNKNCFFSKQHIQVGKECCLPILVVDDDIYRWCPSLLISTIDKFAQVSWVEKVGAIFGRVDKYCSKCGFFKSEHVDDHKETKGKHQDGMPYWTMQSKIAPPALIVQDELHLISGPMGTLTGLYETAIDYFCKNEGHYPKIIASTATTKAATQQIRNLFNREKTSIFPPQGFRFGNTFFAEIDKTDPGKVFVGLSPTAKSVLTVLGRTSASLVRRVRYLQENKKYSDKELDPYFTLVSYFNSLRELGGALSSYKDAVPDFIQTVFERDRIETGQEPNAELNSKSDDDLGLELMAEEEKDIEQIKQEVMEKGKKREYRNKALEIDELTSRQDSGSIPSVLRRLESGLEGKTDPLDILLSTNMLSVGVDIRRLGLMLVNGQPKNHSEYIQATGRIGRNNPGLIVTLYNFVKPRDLSHYENFKYYHSTFFRNVEPISLTPFSARSRDHGLFGLLVGLLRNLVPILAKNDDSKNFKLHIKQINDAVNEIKKEIATRVDSIDPSESQETLDDIDKLLSLWEQYANLPLPLVYKSTFWTSKTAKQNHNYLLKTIEKGETGLAKIPATPLSLREAEQQQRLYYVKGEDDVTEN